MDQWVKGGLPLIRPPFRKRQPGRPKRLRTKEAAEVQVPAPKPPNPLPPGYTALVENLEDSSLKLDVEHVEKKATIEEDVEDRLRQPQMGMLAKLKFKQLIMECMPK
ncbi:hypothetical protein L3X38_022311 [Prunus dulcis]|uniref:Uncharacterized protein n=1 Tax=Prunus dulcis TaxID=3755 RepID=A0AAD4Z3F0_PRUDU|nr:hypothetical protein L3X38_022311 [Prunus dulcis]